MPVYLPFSSPFFNPSAPLLFLRSKTVVGVCACQDSGRHIIIIPRVKIITC